MSRINTNVSSLIAQTRLARSNNQLQESLTRLSTGLRINNGKDDPAGLIASETLRADITATNKAISNSERANQLISTADSALGQISNLLNDIRGLVTEAANEGVLSAAQIDANQLQVDSSLEAIDRIAAVTTFQGRKILDGSLDFITAYTAGGTTVQDLQINQANLGSSGSVAVSVDITTAASQASLTATVAAPGAVAASAVITFNDTATVTVTAAVTGTAFNGIEIRFVDDNAVTAGQATAVYDDANDEIVVHVNGNTAKAIVASAIDALADFTAASGGGGVGFVELNDAALTATTGGGANATGGLVADVVVRIGGSKGSEVFQFDTGATGTSIANAINLLTDSTGVSAAYAGTTLTLTSSDYGSEEFVDVEVISEGVGGTFGSSLSGTRDAGADVIATVNGYAANTRGNTISLNTSALNFSISVDEGSTTDVTFNITGGGAVFQLGPEVQSNQQARIGIAAVNSGSLGGVSGRLYELRSGNANSLANDAAGGAEIVNEALVSVNSLRGRLGAFQRTSLETNIASLSDTVANLSAAESAIRDADFAAESAKLTRAQILVQSGTAVLQIANQNPQNVLALLRS